MNDLNYPWGVALTAAMVVLLLGKPLISQLRRWKLGQMVRKDGPKSHQGKAGTPTMGGVLIVLAAAFVAWIWPGRNAVTVWAIIGMVGFGGIGFLDDFRKFVGQASLGLKAREKLALQTLVAVFVLVGAYVSHPDMVEWIVPFSHHTWVIPVGLFFPVSVFVIVASANAVNLTDGLDGLASGSTAIACLFFLLILGAAGQSSLATFALAVGGACLGFLWFNSHPAIIFMGDTGSLALGAALAFLGIFSGQVLFLPILGVVFVVETLSVIFQVVYFRLSGGKRLFRMSPIHHHFELLGWPETKVTMGLWLLMILGGFVALLG